MTHKDLSLIHFIISQEVHFIAPLFGLRSSLVIVKSFLVSFSDFWT